MATAILYSIRHSRAGGNLGLFSRELAWIPAFAGKTETGPLCLTSRRGAPAGFLDMVNTANKLTSRGHDHLSAIRINRD
jgi:hypothetical protein